MPLIIAGLILLLALTAIIAVLLSRDSTPQTAASSDPAALETPALTADDSMQRPGPVTVRFGARTGDSVLVTWTYANRLPDDTVEYRLGDGQVRTATAFVDGQQVIRIVGKAPACIRIRIVRAASSASAGNPFSARTCETG